MCSPSFVTNIELNEAIWRNHYQLVVSAENDVDAMNPQLFGSAFRLLYRGRKWLITADHVIHPEKHGKLSTPKGVDPDDVKHQYHLINNVNAKNEIATLLTSLDGFYYYKKFESGMLEFTQEELEELGATEDDFYTRLDLAICETPYGLPCPALTHELSNKGEVIVRHGLEKLSLTIDTVSTMPSPGKTYYVYGVVHNDIKGIRFDRCNATHGNLHYIEFKDGKFVFNNPDPIINDDWAGLSGSAIFDNEGKAVGMCLSVDDVTNKVWVMPIGLIIRLIDKTIEYEAKN